MPAFGADDIASFRELHCPDCAHKIRLLFCLTAALPDGRIGYRDVYFCPDCRAYRDFCYPKLQEVDPELYRLRSGNSGRILEYLFRHGPLSLESAAPPVEGEPALPGPKKLQRASRSLLDAGLARLVAGGIQITEEGRRRMEEAQPKQVYCQNCRRPLPADKIPCPVCETAFLVLSMIGRCGDDADTPDGFLRRT